MNEQPAETRLRLASVVASGVMVFSALLIGLWPVAGTYDSESFTCGSALLGTSDDLGYGGSESYDACVRERGHLRWIALVNLAVGVVLLGTAASSRRRSSDHTDVQADARMRRE